MGNARKKWTGETKNEGVRQKAEGPNWPVGYLFLGGGGVRKLYIISKSWVHDHTHPPNPHVGTYLERASFHIMQGVPKYLIPFTFKLRFIKFI